MKKLILLTLTALIMVGCNMAMDSLDIVNGSKFIVKSKTKEKLTYLYHLTEEADSWYTYEYIDTADYNVGDTIVITVRRASD